MPVSSLHRTKPFLIAAAALLALATAAWLVLGPVFLSRTVDFTINAKNAGPKWSLEWQDSAGATLSGVWIEAKPDESGALRLEVHQPVPNYAFSRLALKWWGAPGLEMTDPGLPRLSERVLGLSFEPPLERAPTSLEGTVLGHDSYTSSKPDGGAVWLVPRWTAARALDLAAVCALTLLAALAAYGVFRLGGARPPYSPEAAAIIAVALVHTWLAWRSPMFFCPDSMDYAVNALSFIEKPAAIVHLHPWRLPGYSVFLIPFLKAMGHYTVLLGWAQGALAVLTAWVASRITRAFLTGPWAALTILLVGLDPVLMLWTRHAMPELLCALLVTLIARGAVRQRLWAQFPLYWAAPAAVGLGVLLGALCYVRGNYQVLVVLAPVAIAMWPAMRGDGRRALLLGLLLFLGASSCLAPAFVSNYREYKRAEFMVGSGYTQALSLLEEGALDRNNVSAFSFEEWQDARTSPPGSPGSNEFLAKLRAVQQGPLAEQTKDLPPWTNYDRRGAAVARESIARHPTQRLAHSARALMRLLGLWDPPVGSENDFWSAPMRRPQGANLTHRLPPAHYRELQQSKVQNIYDRTAQSTLPWINSGEASFYDELYKAAAAVRPLWAVLFLLGVTLALARREWCLFVLGLIPIAHAAALSVLLFDGIDRYQAPLYPLMSVLACYALACTAGALRARPDQSSRTAIGQ